MNVQDIPRGAEDHASAALLGAAAALLAKRRPDIPADFIAALFGNAVPDDLARYTADELAAMAERSWALLAERVPGSPKIRFEEASAPRDIAVLEIVNDDMPFLVDSVAAELNQRGLDIRLFVHPVFAVMRDRAGKLVDFKGARASGSLRESFICVHVEAAGDAQWRLELVHTLEDVLADVRAAVADWRPMLTRIRAIIADLREKPPPLAVDEIAEAVQFLEWIADDNFTLLGARDFVFRQGDEVLEPVFETGLGLLRSRDTALLQHWNDPLPMTPEIRAFLKEPKLLIVTKSTARSPVHRRVQLDYLGIKRFDSAGKLVGEYRFCGLFTSTAYTRPARSIPYLRRKIDSVIRRAGFDPSSHSGKALVNVLETYPRDELFQLDDETLYQFALAVLQLDERPRVRVLPRRDRFDRFMSVLVFIPRDRYGGQIRAAIGTYLADAFKGRLTAYYPFFPEGPL
ncbi:MAG: NAD-glutamate dehydrogenase, partial [Xanthobacteraceae bacterium]